MPLTADMAGFTASGRLSRRETLFGTGPNGLRRFSVPLLLTPQEKIRLQIDILDTLPKKKRDKIADPAAYLVIAIRNGHAAPSNYISKAERERRAEAKRQAEQKVAEDRRREQAEAAREKAERQAINAYWASLTPPQQAELEAAAIAQADADTLALTKGPTRRIGLTIVRDQYIRQLLNDRQGLPAKA
jgi:hypothetical protein